MTENEHNAERAVLPAVVRSRTVIVAEGIKPGVRRVLRIPDGLLTFVDWIVGAATVYLDDADPRPAGERVTEWFSTTLEEADSIRMDEFTVAMEYLSNAPEGWISRLGSHLSRPFVLRLLGAATYKDLTDAAKQDSAVVIRAVQRLALQLRPMALALEDAITLVSEDQLAASGLTALPVKLLQMMFDLEEQATTKLLPKLGIDIDPAFRPIDGEMSAVIEELRILVAADSIEQVQRIGKLKNKISGARQALDRSDDGVSQASNSLVELIDRSFRESYPKEVVLRWIADVFPGDIATYTHEVGGERRPTKFAEALCFAAGGATRGDVGTGIHRILALALVGARSRLQKFKHNDDPTDEKRQEVRQIMLGVEGAMVIAVRIGFGLAQMAAGETNPEPAGGRTPAAAAPQ